MLVRRPVRRQIRYGKLKIGGNAPVSVQTMTNTRTADVKATVRQIKELERAGAELVRLAVLDRNDIAGLREIRKEVELPLVADIHFDHRLAIRALEAGVDGLRINPGNITDRIFIEEVARAAREKKVPIRVGVNSGSVEKGILKKFGAAIADALVESAVREVEILESTGFFDIEVSLKSSSVPVTIEAYRKFAALTDYPLHIGITEAGPPETGIAKSALGLGILLLEGIGDTLRVSLSGDPVKEVIAGKMILEELRPFLEESR